MLSFFKKYSKLFLKGSRVKTLLMSLIPSFMSMALVYKHSFVFDKTLFLLTCFSILFIQIAVNLFNDALDGKEGLDNKKERLGPLRLVGSGEASFFEVRAMGFFACIMAVLLAIPLIFKGGILVLIMGFLSLLSCYFYTGSSYSLVKMGLAEIFCFIFFGFFIVFGVYYIQTLKFSWDLIYLSIQCGFWSVSFLLINYLRDEKIDKKRGRKHFVTLLGRENSLFVVGVFQAFIYLLCFYWLNSYPKAGILSFCAIFFSCFLLYQMYQRTSQKYNQCLAFLSFSYSFFCFMWILGLFL
ncbi:MAG: prenyltransferase [Bdellovibrionales bacterium]|nr:prenyltransferase [Bdellovibrionales bacterium]